MTTQTLETIADHNLSRAWARTLLMLLERPQSQVSPFMLSLSGLQNGLPVEDGKVRSLMDAELRKLGKYSSQVSAMLIFPYNEWLRRGKPECAEFSEWYLQHFFPRLQARDTRNSRGTYFQRMIAASGIKVTGGKTTVETSNQLNHIITIWNRDKQNGKRPRHTALQVSCFDPVKDHTGSALLGFPCLQQLAFAYDEAGLSLTAFYPTQYVFDRGYGNYLGLCHLGHFMASQMELEFVQLNCVVMKPELGHEITKTMLVKLEQSLRGVLKLPKKTLVKSSKATKPSVINARAN